VLESTADPSANLSLLFSSSNQPAAQTSGPPSSLGAASKPRRKSSAKAGAVTGFLAQHRQMMLCLIETIVHQAAAQFDDTTQTRSFISVVAFISIRRIVKCK
jgi:hypothetical protein